MLLPIMMAACGEDIAPPPPTGSIAGQVMIESQGADGVSVTLSSGATATTAGGGSYRFDNIEPGTYTVSIAGFPAEASFDATSMSVTVGTTGGTATANFSGTYIRTASVRGSVTVEGTGLAGVTVSLSGMADNQATTSATGEYSFTGLRAGRYSVQISGFDADEVAFSSISGTAEVGVGDTKVVSFDGTYLRTAGITGRVSVEGTGLEGVTVSLSGGESNQSTQTDAGGLFSFTRLRAGDYSVAISGYDTDEVGFDATSRSVTVALGETANVQFDGNYLRTAGITGRVSVEGMGLAGVTVTLESDDTDDMMDTTDASGMYAFGALAAGDYTVSIMVTGDAYVFDMTSMDITLADDALETVNFMGAHATTASISGMLFVDEATKNDMHDEGEDALEIQGIPVVLVGPGVTDRTTATTDDKGMFQFSDLKAGSYVLAVVTSPDVTKMLGDHAYGGSATGYDLTVAVGEHKKQHLPYDITHQTVHYSVTLRHGDNTGDALQGASVMLYADAAGSSMVAKGTTDKDGMAMIRFARSMATGGAMVHAKVMSDDYHVEDKMQAVRWSPKSRTTMAANDFDILNLMVDASVSGKTVMTDMGGGNPLAGWMISVTMGGKAVTGAPTKFDNMGMAMLDLEVKPADLPATYTVMLDTVQSDALDGGEKFSATSVMHEHTGLKLMQEMDAGTIEATYSTQTLKVYVHHERDQVMGYTGNVLGGDMRMSGKIDVDVRYIDATGRSRMFTAQEWNTKNKSEKDGVITFKHLPADAQVMVQAKEKAGAGDIELLDPMELFAFKDKDANGIMKGAFGAMGGFSPMVELCPLMATDPTGQDFGECSTFAYVMTYSVSGNVSRKMVKKHATNEDFDTTGITTPEMVGGVKVDLAPVTGKNLAGMAQSKTTASAGTTKGTFDFGKIAAGAYTFTVPAGWRVRLGQVGSTAMVGNALNPLDTAVMLDVTPTTSTVYGIVTGADGFRVDSVMIDVNGMTTMTDAVGRYIVNGIAPATVNRVGNRIHVKASRHLGSAAKVVAFQANMPARVDLTLNTTKTPVFYSGTVVASGSNAPLAGVSITIDNKAPTNAATAGPNKGKLVTGADGTFRAQIGNKGAGTNATIRASMAGMSFAPESLTLPAAPGTNLSGVNFTGFKHGVISGRTVGTRSISWASPNGPVSGVLIKATRVSDSKLVDSMTTGPSGTYTLSVPFGAYKIEASKRLHGFEYPSSGQNVTAAPGQSISYGDIKVRTFIVLGATGERLKKMRTLTGGVKLDLVDDTVVIVRLANDLRRDTGKDRGHPSGVNGGVQIFPDIFSNGAWHQMNLRFLFADDTTYAGSSGFSKWTGRGYVLWHPTIATPDDTFTVRIRSTAVRSANNPVANGTDTSYVKIPAVDPKATSVKARRATAGTSDSIIVDWTAISNSKSNYRMAFTFPSIADLDGSSATVFAYIGSSTTLNWDSRRSWWVFASDRDWVDFRTVNSASVRVTRKEMMGAMEIRIDSRQGSSGTWMRGAKTSLKAKP